MNLFKKAFIGVFVFVAFASLVPFHSAKATTYNITDVPCGYENQQGYTTALCDGHITILDDTVDPGDTLNLEWWIDYSGYSGLVGAPSQIKFDGQEQPINDTCHNFCKRAWSISGTYPYAPSSDGCYAVDVYYKWTAYGVYDYHYQIPYKVGAGCNAGAGNTPQPTVMANANPTQVISGNSSIINYSSLNATSCHISKNNVVKAYRCPTSGSYTTGALTSNTQYQIECGREGSFNGTPDPGCSGGGTTAMNSLPFAKTNLFDKIKNFISNLIPEAIASQVTSAVATVNITVTNPPAFNPTLSLLSSNLKDLVKAGASYPIGETHFQINITSLPARTTCNLLNSQKPSLVIEIVNNNTDQIIPFGTYYSNPDSLISGINNFYVQCKNNSNNQSISPVSNTQTVFGQSGTLSSSATSGGVTPCVIPVGSSSCKVKTTWTTTNNQTVPSQVLTYFSGATVSSPANSGTDVDTTITSASGSTVPRSVVISTNNKVDSENNTATINNSTDNQLATLPVSVSCATGSSWNSTTGICQATAIGVDIFADPAGPVTEQGSTHLVWTTTGSPTSCDATGTDWSGTNIQNNDPVTYRSGMLKKTYNFGIVCHKAGTPDASDTVSFVVDENLNPVVNAGPDIVSTANSITISSASASDPDGPAPLALSWTKILGPAVTITNGTTLTPTFSGLTNGLYNFQLKATENGPGKSIADNLQISITSGNSYPTLTISDATAITLTSATLNASVTSNGGASLINRGFCLGKTPSMVSACIGQGGLNPPIGNFSQNRSSLESGTTYYFIAYATNSVGTGYSAYKSFTTIPGTLTVTANPTYYSVSPSGKINFTYTSSINVTPSPNRQCRLLDYSYAPLTGWENADTTIVNNAPSAVGSYSYYIGCRKENDNSIVGISSKISVDVVASAPPSVSDLVITNTWPTSVYTGMTTFYGTVLNAGTVGTGNPFTNRFQVSDKIDLSGTITNYDTTQMDPVESGVSKMTERAINFPTAGTYYMRACADIPPANPGAIAEGDESNNCSAEWVPVTVIDGAPDLIASTPTPTEVNTGNSTFYSNITNQGNGGTVIAFNNQFQVSTTSNGSNIIGTYPTSQMSALGPYITGGTSVAISFPTAGTYYMRACADIPPANPGKVTNESNELNNCSSWVPITASTGYPDLVISNISPKDPDDIWVGTTTFYASVTNQGQAGTGGQFANRFQVSTLANGGGTITNYDSVPMMALGQYITGGTSASINFPTVGTYYMRACADIPPVNPGAISESDETNNCSSNWVPVTIKQPVVGVDLTASIPHPSYVTTGTTTFYSDITNSGTSGTILPFTNRFQVSTTSDGNNIIGTHDTTSMSALGSLMTGGTSASINFPTVGTYYMRACADIPPANPGAINEGSNEGNNCSGWGTVHVEECANGATNYPVCTMLGPVVNGQCNLNTINGCLKGNIQNVDDSADSYLWNCLGENGGTDDFCSKSKDVDPKPELGTLIFYASPSWIFKGRPSTLHWASNANPGTCVGEGFDTGGLSTGSVVVNPERTTVYAINGCSEIGVDLGKKETKVRVISPIIIEI